MRPRVRRSSDTEAMARAVRLRSLSRRAKPKARAAQPQAREVHVMADATNDGRLSAHIDSEVDAEIRRRRDLELANALHAWCDRMNALAAPVGLNVEQDVAAARLTADRIARYAQARLR